MAMLAEPRRRKRYNLCPRGKALYEDDARFGTKMLEKMGWSKGKGLGANEDGQQEFVRVRLKNDAEGLGFEARDDQWTVHEEGFNGLLKSLNGGTDETNAANGAASASEDEARPMGFGFKAAEPEEPPKKKLKEKISGISLEEASKASKARVHYKKFTRGKDLSQYSEKDLANIFGKKATDDIDAPAKIELPQVEEKEINPNFSGVTTVPTGLSVHDYFKQKMEAMKNRLKNGSASTPKPSEQEETEIDQNEPIKKKKKKDKERTVEVPAEVEETVEPKQKKKKKSKRAPDHEVEEDKTEKETPLEEVSLDETAPKKKKKSKEVVEAIERPIVSEPIQEEANESLKKKKKSREDKKVAETKEDAESQEATVVPQEAENSSTSKSKKKKRSKETVDSLSEPVEEITSKASKSTPEESSEEAPLKKKKKSKKVREIDEDVVLESEITEKSSNKKKKSKRDVADDPAPAPAEDTGRKHKDAVSAEPNSSGDKSEQSADEDQPEELLSLDEIKEKIKLFNICTISQFCADKFQMFDMNAFRDSTLTEITGYGSSADMELKVEEMKHDDRRIMDLWKNESYASFKKSDRFRNIKYPKQVQRTTLRAVKKRFAFQAI